MGTAYISRFGHWPRVATADGRISVLELFRDKEWKSQRYILQDEQILPELMNSEHPMVARGARILHLLSLNYSTPYITTPAKIHAAGRQWRLAEQLIEAISRISEKPESLRNCDNASSREYCYARSQYLDLLKTAIDHYNHCEETDTHIHTAIRHLVQARRLVRLMEPGYFLSQERQKVVLPEKVLYASVQNNALPPGTNIIMCEPRKTKAARSHETLTPQIVRGRSPWARESPTLQTHKGRTREATYINIPPTPRYDPLAKSNHKPMGSTSHVLPHDIFAANQKKEPCATPSPPPSSTTG